MEEDNKSKKLYTIEQAAKYISSTVSMVKMYANPRFKECRGFGLKRTRIGNKPYFSMEDLDQFIVDKIRSYKTSKGSRNYINKLNNDEDFD